jgi:hypothetical protein
MALVIFGTSTLFNQDHINDPSTYSSINDRDLLRDFVSFTLCFPPECSIPRVLDLVPRIHFQINGCRPLWDFGLRLFQISSSPCSASPESFYPEFHDMMTCVLSRSMTPSCFGYSVFDDFKLYSFIFSRSTFTWSSRSFTTYPLDLMVLILFRSSALRASGVSESYALVSPGMLSPELHGFLPRIPLQWTVVLFFGLRGFRILSHSSLGNL